VSRSPKVKNIRNWCIIRARYIGLLVAGRSRTGRILAYCTVTAGFCLFYGLLDLSKRFERLVTEIREKVLENQVISFWSTVYIRIYRLKVLSPLYFAGGSTILYQWRFEICDRFLWNQISKTWTSDELICRWRRYERSLREQSREASSETDRLQRDLDALTACADDVDAVRKQVCNLGPWHTTQFSGDQFLVPAEAGHQKFGSCVVSYTAQLMFFSDSVKSCFVDLFL